MLRRLFILLSLISLLLALFLLFLPLYSLVTNPHLSVNLPLGLQLSADASHFPAQLTFTLWKPETKQWWLSRPPNSPINITASKTVEISDGSRVIHGARLYAEFATKSFAGFELRRGAVSKGLLTASFGAMSTPLVPYRSLSMPWFYPLPLTLILPTVYLILRHRHRRRHRLGLCLTCGYDLRASKDKCPECGSPIPQSEIENPK